jgi:transcriptional regulator with GAF, ATPase, and Fis domain
MNAELDPCKPVELAASTPLLDKGKLLESIFRISVFMTKHASVDQFLKIILDEVVETIGFHRGIIRLLDESKQCLIAKVVRNYTPEEARKAFDVALDMNLHDCLAVKVMKSGQSLSIEDASTDPRITDTDRMLTNVYGQGSIFVAPLKAGEDVIGILGAWWQNETRFYPEQISLFQAYAGQISIMIHNARLFEANAEKIRMLMILQHAVSEMNSSYILDNRILDILSRSALEISDADKVAVYFLDMAKNRCFIYDGEKVFIGDQAGGDQRIRASIIARAIDENTYVVRNALQDAVPTAPLFEGFPVEIAIPLNIKDKFSGALYLAKKAGGYLSDQINILDVLVNNAVTAYDNAIMHSLLSLEAKKLKNEVEELKKREEMLLGFHNILGQSEKMINIFRMIENIAAHNTNVLVQGESGTGKELIARAIHRQSDRRGKHFVDVNCAAIPGTLLESELFGYEAGAFTDARKRKIGLLEYASGGTLLLDEIGDMNIHLQAKFLRMLEDGYIRRLGGTENVPVDVRFIFSSNQDLTRMVAEGKFREDLFYRVSVVPIVIPPLRDRAEDIMLLAQYYIDEFNRKFQKNIKGFSRDAESILKSYAWPGNVRELKNIIERVMILKHSGHLITQENLPAEMKADIDQAEAKTPVMQWMPAVTSEGMDYESVTGNMTREITKAILQNALDMAGHNKSKAARLLNISRYKFMRELNKTNRVAGEQNKSVRMMHQQCK